MLVGLAPAAISGACAWPYGYCLRKEPEWRHWTESTFAHVHVEVGRSFGAEARGFEDALEAFLGAHVEYWESDYEAWYWADLDVPRALDLDALHAFVVRWERAGVRHPKVYLYTNWVFAGATASVRDTGQAFPIDCSPGDGPDQYALLVSWPRDGGPAVLTPTW